jgi:succinyl-diaminopimelate desuccinylase
VARPFELTWVFYAREEVSRSQSGLLELAELRPDLLVADAAILAEPTGGAVEAGCQGTMRIDVTLRGVRAHTARPFMGRNAIHRMGELVSRVASYVPRSVEVDGIAFVEQLQVVRVEGGVANNVVPNEARATLNHRIAPDRGSAEAASAVRALIEDVLEDGDDFEVVDYAPAAAPSLDNDVISRLVEATGGAVRAKVGWTDVATFAERGVPAANFGAGDPLLAHRSDEFVTREELEGFGRVLAAVLTSP